MAAADITQFAAIFVASVNGRLGAAAPTADLTAFTAAAQNLAMVASAPPSAAAWAAASDGWTMARDRLAGTLAGYLTDGLPQIPGLDGLLDNVGWSSPEGLHGDLEFGPLKLALAASSLTDTFNKLGGEFQTAHPGVTVKFEYGGSATLAQQNTVLQAQNDQLSRELAATKSKLTTRL